MLKKECSNLVENGFFANKKLNFGTLSAQLLIYNAIFVAENQ